MTDLFALGLVGLIGSRRIFQGIRTLSTGVDLFLVVILPNNSHCKYSGPHASQWCSWRLAAIGVIRVVIIGIEPLLPLLESLDPDLDLDACG